MTAEGLTLDPERLLEEESRLALPSLGEADAIALGLLVLTRAEARSLPVVIEIRRGGRVLFRAARPGTSPDNDVWIAGKAAVVERFGHSTWYMRCRYLAEGTTFEAATGLAFPAYAAHGGGFPLVVAGTGPVGVLLVSGLPQEQDHALIVDCLHAFLAGARA